ncbi:MAG: AIPR family protein [Alphaproteobacteria bacterium]|nr:AIPR family protein [Alphaproteobacteria bacterium]
MYPQQWITIISPDVRVNRGRNILRDFQIVNGCQTSNVLFEHRLKLRMMPR